MFFWFYLFPFSFLFHAWRTSFFPPPPPLNNINTSFFSSSFAKLLYTHVGLRPFWLKILSVFDSTSGRRFRTEVICWIELAVIVVKSGSKGKEVFRRSLPPSSAPSRASLETVFPVWVSFPFWCYCLVADANFLGTVRDSSSCVEIVGFTQTLISQHSAVAASPFSSFTISTALHFSVKLLIFSSFYLLIIY